MPQKSSAFAVSDSDSEGSVVFVRSGIAPKERSSTVKKFGGIDSDDDVSLDERKRRPSASPMNESSPTKVARLDTGPRGSQSTKMVSSSASPEKSNRVSVSSRPGFVFGEILPSDNESDHEPRTPLTRKTVVVPSSSTSRPQRTPKPTEKARYNADDTPSGSLIKKLDALHAAETLTPVPSPRSDSDESYKPRRPACSAARRKGKKKVAAANVKPDVKMESPTLTLRELSSQDDDLPSPVTATRSRAKRSDTPVPSSPCHDEDDVDNALPVSHSSPVKDNVSSKRCLSPEWDEDALQALSPPVEITPKKGKGKATELPARVSSRNIDKELPLVPVDVQDGQPPPYAGLLDEESIPDKFRAMYADMDWLPPMKRHYFVGHPLNMGEFHGFMPMNYSTVRERLDAGGKKKLVRALGFMSAPPVYSPVRVPLRKTGFIPGRFCLLLPPSEGASNAIFTTVGLVKASHLQSGVPSQDGPSRQLHVVPFENDFEILQTNIGDYFASDMLHTSCRKHALVFSTRKEPKVPKDEEPDDDDDDLRAKPRAKPSKVPIRRALGSVFAPGAPACRMFDDGIPIYDGRTTPGSKGFTFTPAEWDNYMDLPVFPLSEVPRNSLVVVAHTIHGFVGKLAPTKYHTLLLNPLFAIVLSDPVQKAK
ncbi:hypothetical protein VNI00_017684 [Paramarasmius palmivorus]|uniref:Uncharacterized protein n=1 Tax=Paramarasmius palmivorus TaxID=297713 RepID=A0AAW0AXR9_9AGAR